MTTPERVLEDARAEIGTVESPAGSNRTKYGRAYGMDGEPWCLMFVWWVFTEADARLPLKSAYTPTMAAAFQREGRWRRNDSPNVKPGDLVFFFWPSMGRIAHVGIVEVVHPDGTLTTIEGNTDSAGGRSGGRVMRQRRSRATVHPNGGFGVPVWEEDDDMGIFADKDDFKATMRDVLTDKTFANLTDLGGKPSSVKDLLVLAYRGLYKGEGKQHLDLIEREIEKIAKAVGTLQTGGVDPDALAAGIAAALADSPALLEAIAKAVNDEAGARMDD